MISADFVVLFVSIDWTDSVMSRREFHRLCQVIGLAFVFDRSVLDDGIALLRSFLSDGEKSNDVLVDERIGK